MWAMISRTEDGGPHVDDGRRHLLLEERLHARHLLGRVAREPVPQERLHDPGERRAQGDRLPVADARSLRRLLAGEEPVELIEDAGPEGRRAPEVEPRPGLELPVDGLGRTREAAHAARVARTAPVAIALDEVHAADLGIRLPVALEVEDELEDVAGGSPDERRPLAYEQIAEIKPLFRGGAEVYARTRTFPPSLRPVGEALLKACLLIALYSVRSERQFCERLHYDLLFRWFLDLPTDGATFDASTFAKNKTRVLNTEVARRFFDGVVAAALRAAALGRPLQRGRDTDRSVGIAQELSAEGRGDGGPPAARRSREPRP